MRRAIGTAGPGASKGMKIPVGQALSPAPPLNLRYLMLYVNVNCSRTWLP